MTHRHRLLDPDKRKEHSSKDAALSHVISRDFGGRKNYVNTNANNEKLRGAVNPMYKAIERHEERSIRKGGKKSVRNIRGKIGYFKHLDARARNRGEEDL